MFVTVPSDDSENAEGMSSDVNTRLDDEHVQLRWNDVVPVTCVNELLPTFKALLTVHPDGMAAVPNESVKLGFLTYMPEAATDATQF